MLIAMMDCNLILMEKPNPAVEITKHAVIYPKTAITNAQRAGCLREGGGALEEEDVRP